MQRLVSLRRLASGGPRLNQRSIGFEIDSFASTSGEWTTAFYRSVAHVCAWAIESLGILRVDGSGRPAAAGGSG